MKIPALTSTLALTLLMAGPQAIAMEIEDQTGNGNISVTQQTSEEVTESDILAKSVFFPDTVTELKNAYDAKDLDALEQVVKKLKAKVAEKKTESNQTQTPTVESLSTEDQKSFSWFTNWFSKKETTEVANDPIEETKDSSTTPVITLPVEERSETSASLVIEQSSTEQLESSSFYWLNPLYWLGYGAKNAATNDGEEETTKEPLQTTISTVTEPTATDTDITESVSAELKKDIDALLNSGTEKVD